MTPPVPSNGNRVSAHCGVIDLKGTNLLQRCMVISGGLTMPVCSNNRNDTCLEQKTMRPYFCCSI